MRRLPGLFPTNRLAKYGIIALIAFLLVSGIVGTVMRSLYPASYPMSQTLVDIGCLIVVDPDRHKGCPVIAGTGTSVMPPRYKDRRTERFVAGERVREFQAFARQAYKRLEVLEAAPNREALVLLPSNRFEALGGDRKGQYSIRINDRWRVCFEWPEGEPHPFSIEIVDYHA